MGTQSVPHQNSFGDVVAAVHVLPFDPHVFDRQKPIVATRREYIEDRLIVDGVFLHRALAHAFSPTSHLHMTRKRCEPVDFELGVPRRDEMGVIQSQLEARRELDELLNISGGCGDGPDVALHRETATLGSEALRAPLLFFRGQRQGCFVTKGSEVQPRDHRQPWCVDAKDELQEVFEERTCGDTLLCVRVVRCKH